VNSEEKTIKKVERWQDSSGQLYEYEQDAIEGQAFLNFRDYLDKKANEDRLILASDIQSLHDLAKTIWDNKPAFAILLAKP
jgi:hypothetical protein